MPIKLNSMKKLNIKNCSTCKKDKSLSEFGKAKVNVDGLNGRCRECIKKYMKRYAQNNAQMFLDASAASYKKKTTAYRELLQNHGCQHCGNDNPIVLVAHHIDPSTKVQSVKYIIDHRTYELAMEEFKKCIVLCRNCHAIEHQKMSKETSNANSS